MKKELRIVFASGPGDVIGTYEYWKKGQEDPREVSATYSGQFYSVCRELNAKAKVLAQREGGRRVMTDDVTIEEWTAPFRKSSHASLFHLGQMIGAIMLAWKAARFRADVMVVLEGTHWFALTLARLLGIRIVPDIHCTLWPMGHPPQRIVKRQINRLNGWFWACVPTATLCISPECERQILLISRQKAGNLIATRPTYGHGLFDNLPPAPIATRPFVLFCAGRIERNKGVFDLVQLMQKLETAKPGAFRCVICGSGGAEEELARAVSVSRLSSVIKLAGQLKQPEMMAELSNSHVVIVPTTAAFVEGLNRVAVEGILAGRPVILTTVCPAWELISEGAITVAPGDVEAMFNAAMRLENDHAFYEKKRKACATLEAQFYDQTRSWGAGLQRAVHLAMSARYPKSASARQLA